MLNDISKEINKNITIIPYKEIDNSGKSKYELSKEYDKFFLKRENSIIINTFYIQIINTFICKYKFESYLFKN